MGTQLVEEEVQVLRAIYGDDAVTVLSQEEETRLEVDLRPRVEQGAALVSVTLAVRLPPGYPLDKEPQVQVERSRGLGDAALGTILETARRACAEHGLQEVGCVSQILDEVSEALDVANDTSECNICLAPCCPGQGTLYTSCGHIFHVSCIGHWDALKAAEAEAAASKASESTRATRDSLQREVGDAAHREAELKSEISEATAHAKKCTALADVARIKHAGGRQAEELEIDAELAEGLVDEEGEEIPLDQLVEKVRVAKAEEKRLLSDERRMQTRLAELVRQLDEMESSLAKEASVLATASLPCPVCRAPIERRFLPERGRGHAQPSPQSSSPASVAALPEDLRKQVRELQSRHRQLMAKQQENQAADPISEAVDLISEAPHATEVTRAPQAAEEASRARNTGRATASQGYSISAAVAGAQTSESDWNSWSWNSSDGRQWYSGWESSRSGHDSGKWGSKGGKAPSGRSRRWGT